MKILKTSILLLSLLVLAISCKKDEETPSIIGNWETVSATGSSQAMMNIPITLSKDMLKSYGYYGWLNFVAENKVYVDTKIPVEPKKQLGTWSQDASDITIVLITPQLGMSNSSVANMNGNTLTIPLNFTMNGQAFSGTLTLSKQ